MSADRRAVALAVASGLVFASTAPPLDLPGPALVGLVGLAVAFARSRSPWRVGLAFGLAANALALRFVPAVLTRFTDLPTAAGLLALGLLSAAQALPWALGASIAGRLRRLVPAPLALAVGVYAGSFVPALFPWTVLTGAYLELDRGLGTNSAILVRADGSLAPPYDKRHLLWFGETVPLADVFPVLRRVFARGTGLVPGRGEVALTSGSIRAAVLDCYEDTLPEAGREAMSVGPNLLVNVTNDAWFAGSAESQLHLRLATLRAIELRRDLVRAVNAGPTSWVDATGRVRAEADAGPVVLPVTPALLAGAPTPYARFGDAPLLAVLALGLGAASLRARNAKRAPPPEG